MSFYKSVAPGGGASPRLPEWEGHSQVSVIRFLGSLQFMGVGEVLSIAPFGTVTRDQYKEGQAPDNALVCQRINRTSVKAVLRKILPGKTIAKDSTIDYHLSWGRQWKGGRPSGKEGTIIGRGSKDGQALLNVLYELGFALRPKDKK